MESKIKLRWVVLSISLATAVGVSWLAVAWLAGAPASGSDAAIIPDERSTASLTQAVSSTADEHRRVPVEARDVGPNDRPDPPPKVGQDEAPLRDRSGLRPVGSDFLSPGGQFGTASEIASDRRYNPGGVVLSQERRAELGELLSSLERGYESIMVPLRKARDAEIQARIASGNYDRLPAQGPVRYRGKRGHVTYTRQDATLGRIGIQFHPRDVPALAEAFANREAFLEEAEQRLRAFFY